MGELERTGRRVLIVSTANLQRPLALAAAGPLLEGDLLDQDGLGGGYEGGRLLVGVDGLDDGDLPGGESVVLALHQAGVGRGEPLEGDLVELIQTVHLVEALLGVVHDVGLNVLVEVLVEGHVGPEILSVLGRLLDQSDDDHDEHEDSDEAAEDDDHGDHPVQLPVLT